MLSSESIDIPVGMMLIVELLVVFCITTSPSTKRHSAGSSSPGIGMHSDLSNLILESEIIFSNSFSILSITTILPSVPS